MHACLFILYVFAPILVINDNNSTIDEFTHYDEFIHKCISVRDKWYQSNKRKSVFRVLFDDIHKTDAIMFMYSTLLWHTQNIYHQFNWYLAHFHEIIASTALLNAIKQYSALPKYNITQFNIIIIFPQHNIKSYEWAVYLFKTYPFKLRWGNTFKTINVECYYYNTASPMYINPDTMYINDYLIQQMINIHSINNCITLTRNQYGLLDYTHNDWISQHQAYYPWITEWINNYKHIYNMSVPKTCTNGKWNILLIQRQKNDRLLLDTNTEADVYDELVNNLDLTLFNITRVSFEEDNLSVLQQAEFINNNDIIIGVHGAALTNIIFMNQGNKTCHNVTIKPALIEIGFRFGWCSDYDFYNKLNKSSQYKIFYHNFTNELLLERWNKCMNKYYKKAEFYSLLYSFIKHTDVNDSSHFGLRYCEVNAVRYGDENDRNNFIRKKIVYVNTSFLIQEIMNVYKQPSYDFSIQIQKYQDTIYSRPGMLLPGHAQNLNNTVAVMQAVFLLISLCGIIIWCLPENARHMKVSVRIFGNEYKIFKFN